MFIEYYALAVYVAIQYLKEPFKSGPGRQFYRALPLSGPDRPTAQYGAQQRASARD